MKRILKYPLPALFYEDFVIDIPNGSDILDVQAQDNRLVMWVLAPVDTDRWGYRTRGFIWMPTGVEFEADDTVYLETVQVGSMVYHLFEIVEE